MILHEARTPVTILVAAVGVALIGCSNPFRETYESRLELWSGAEPSALLPATGPPKLVTSDRLRRDAVRMMENGYVLLGRSQFTGTDIDGRAALAQAEDVGASVVLLQAEYAKTVTEAVPMTEWIPDRTVTYTIVEEVQTGPDAGALVEREVTRTIEGEFQTYYIPETSDYYDVAATFWAKAKAPRFGVLVQPLTNEAKQEIESNRGVMVRTVIIDSPAYEADVLPGDIITRFGDDRVESAAQLFSLIEEHAGEEVSIEVVRDGRRRILTIPLGTA
jgi:hypothetical protein